MNSEDVFVTPLPVKPRDVKDRYHEDPGIDSQRQGAQPIYYKKLFIEVVDEDVR